jgi:hypothetical protein
MVDVLLEITIPVAVVGKKVPRFPPCIGAYAVFGRSADDLLFSTSDLPSLHHYQGGIMAEKEQHVLRSEIENRKHATPALIKNFHFFLCLLSPFSFWLDG